MRNGLAGSWRSTCFLRALRRLHLGRSSDAVLKEGGKNDIPG